MSIDRLASLVNLGLGALFIGLWIAGLAILFRFRRDGVWYCMALGVLGFIKIFQIACHEIFVCFRSFTGADSDITPLEICLLLMLPIGILLFFAGFCMWTVEAARTIREVRELERQEAFMIEKLAGLRSGAPPR